MIVGFTGTRKGMNGLQKKSFESLIRELSPSEFHHGDCVGADADAHNFVAELVPACVIHIHPPQDNLLRAWKIGAVTHEPLTHFARNRVIVDMCELLIGVSVSPVRLSQGGTWYTIDRAVKREKEVRVVWPNGQVTER